MPYVAGGEDALHARLQQQGKTLQVPPPARQAVAQEVPAGDDVALLVAFDLLGQPTRARLGADKNEQRVRRDGRHAPGEGIFEGKAFEPSFPATAHDPGIQADLYVLCRLDLLY